METLKHLGVFLVIMAVLGGLVALVIWGIGWPLFASIIVTIVGFKAKSASCARAKREMDEKAAKSKIP